MMAIEQDVMPLGVPLKTPYLIWKTDDKLSLFSCQMEDPDTYIRQYGKENLKNILSKPSLTEFLFAHLSPQVDFQRKKDEVN